MKKIYLATSSNELKSVKEPKKSTVEFIKQFARIYACHHGYGSSINEMVLN
ncbi:MAG: hypothetical protein ACI308_11185 [Muribaculaceae bacterium]